MNLPFHIKDLTPHKLTVNNLLSLERDGAFAGIAKVELLDGMVYEMRPQSTAHFKARNRLTFRLQSAIISMGLPFEAYSDATVAIGETNAPEPDIIICTELADTGFAPVETVQLAVEISVSTLKNDLGFKKALYASAGIPEYWVIDIAGQQMHQFWLPEGEDYRKSATYGMGEIMVCQSIADLSIETAALI